MKPRSPLADEIEQAFATMPAQLQAAARFVIDNPEDVALLSMREQAKRAGVPPATMIRLAQRLDYAGYDEIRAVHAESVRRQSTGVASRAKEQIAGHRAKGQAGIAVKFVESAARHVDALGSASSLPALVAAAKRIASARRIYVVGLRPSYAVAFHLSHLLELIGLDVRMLEGPGGTGIDRLAGAGDADVLVGISVHPYTRETLRLAEITRELGCYQVAITDSVVSPLAKNANVAVIVGIESPSFFHSMTSSVAAVEALAALAAAECGEHALRALEVRDQHFKELELFLMPRPKRRLQRVEKVRQRKRAPERSS
ncbi:DNA-binding protein [Pandoraea captiosa]|uniref:DNA-binding protein n=1 Tax=Pandoraea captiosa TaxID=2508302 RepID=A0A5E4ZWC2_9BURK|nr:MurR/RpiR family transcriptional regulator [Pandoraea captiosa]VVE64593.1 DNA-binding protein [Pandoraea captiosa]